MVKRTVFLGLMISDFFEKMLHSDEVSRNEKKNVQT